MNLFQQGMTALIPTPAAPATPAPKIAVPIPKYSGDPNENANSWLLQIKNMFRAQGINDANTRIYYAGTGLQGAALNWYLQKTTINNAFTDWNDFAQQLRGAFEPPHYQQHLRKQLKQLRQIGSVHEYGTQFRNLVGQITAMEELDKVAYFIDGLKQATKMEVNYQAPETLEDAWKLAIRYDTAMFGLGRPKNGNSQPMHQGHKGFTDHRGYKNPRPTPIELGSTEYRKKNGPPRNNNCHTCGKPGHWKNDCPNNRNQHYHNNNKGYQGKAKISVIEKQPSSSSPSSSSPLAYNQATSKRTGNNSCGSMGNLMVRKPGS